LFETRLSYLLGELKEDSLVYTPKIPMNIEVVFLLNTAGKEGYVPPVL